MATQPPKPPAPLPESELSGSQGIPIKPDPQALEELRGDANFRRWVGFAATFIGLATITLTIGFGLRHPSIELPETTPPAIAIIVFVERGLLSLAAIVFGYTMLRVAERMFLPRHLIKDASDVELVRILVGADSPGRAVLKAAKESVSIISDLAHSVAEVAHGAKEKKKEEE